MPSQEAVNIEIQLGRWSMFWILFWYWIGWKRRVDWIIKQHIVTSR